MLELYEQQREESLERVAQKLELEPEDVRATVEVHEAPPELPEVPTRSGMLLTGTLLGAGALYLALMRGLVPYPRREQPPGGSPGPGSPNARAFPNPHGGFPGGSGTGV